MNDTFIGRRLELQALDHAALKKGLTVVVGPPGVGKTRLLSQWLLTRSDAVVCTLGAAKTAADIEAIVAEALGVDAAAHARHLLLQNALLTRPSVCLCLDNAEHVVEPLQQLLPLWLNNAGLHIVVTSRKRMRLDNEHVLTLEPLSTTDAVALLSDRCRLTDNEPLARGIVAKLDGLPLAIELAASRARLLSLQEVHERLQSDRRFLASRTRQATLYDAIEWSIALLPKPVAEALSRMAIFPQTFTAQEAEAVCAGLFDASGTLDALAILHEHSLLRRLSGERTRFVFYDSVREVGRLRPLSDETTRAFVAHMAGVVTAALDDFGQPHDDGAEEALVLSRANVLEALRLAAPDDDRAITALVQGTLAIVMRCGPYELADEVLSTSARVLEAAGDTVRMRLALATAEGARLAARYVLARETAAKGAEQAHRAGLDAFEGRFVCMLGRMARDFGDFATALPLTRRAVALAQTDKLGLAAALADLGWIERNPEPFYEALLLLAKANRQRPRYYTVSTLGCLCAELGDFGTGIDHLNEAIMLALVVNDRRVASCSMTHLGIAQLMSGDERAAERTFREAETIQIETANVRYLCITLVYLGVVCHLRGARAEARAWLQRGLAQARQLQSKWTESFALAHLGALAATGGQRTEAVELIERAIDAGQGLGGAEYQRFLIGQRAFLTDDTTALDDGLRLLSAGGYHTGEVRTALMLLARQHTRTASRGIAVTPRHRLDVSVQDKWIRLDKTTIELQSRGPLWRLMVTLIEHHRHQPLQALSKDALIRAVWESDQKQGLSRLHNAVATLRSLGLKDVLLTRSDGYLLHPEADIAFI